MINSRNIDDLHPSVATACRAFLTQCTAAGLDIIITSTYRDTESQAALYAQGRTAKGNIVTNAPAGQSFHNWRCAFDIVPLRAGKPVWGTKADEDLKLWQRLGKIGEACGLAWGGSWKFKDYPHFQLTQGLAIADFLAGRGLRATL